ncbi:MAG TPA: hypothetical protein VKA53_05370 [Thermoanaerobaculia bacterium]|nr:hypothetical protein [Thermoanaerobaculia bacterium]
MNREPPDPLEHCVRRRILRCLHRDFAAHTTEELAASVGIDRDDVLYHCRVLAKWGTVKRYEGPSGFLVESLVADDPEVLFLLHATEVEDEASGSA